jgi:hypothetical protein
VLFSVSLDAVHSINTSNNINTSSHFERRKPFVGPFSGAAFLRKPYNPYAVHFRVSYADEVAGMVSFLTKTKGITRFSCLYQNDDFGVSGYDGLIIALEKAFLTLESAGKGFSSPTRPTEFIISTPLNARKERRSRLRSRLWSCKRWCSISMVYDWVGDEQERMKETQWMWKTDCLTSWRETQRQSCL